jgi:hypothetical protein
MADERSENKKRKRVKTAADGSGIPAETSAMVFLGALCETKRPEELKLSGRSLGEFARRVGGDGCIVKDDFLVENFHGYHTWYTGPTDRGIPQIIQRWADEHNPLVPDHGGNVGANVGRDCSGRP